MKTKYSLQTLSVSRYSAFSCNYFIVSILTVSILTAMLALGCVPNRSLLAPKDQPIELVGAAVVRTPSPVLREGRDLVLIKSVDGKATNYLENRSVVSPGRHEFHIVIEMRGDKTNRKDEIAVTKVDTTLSFEAKPEREYLIDAREDEQGVWVWAVDTSNDDVVAGSRPLGPKKPYK